MAATLERRRRLRPEQRRALIVAAAAEEFGRRGHREARMEDIARAAGITKAVLYDHFDSKGALHAEVVTRASDELVAAVAAAVGEPGPADGESRFRAGLLAGFRLIEQRPDVRTLLLGEPGADARVAKASMAAQRKARAAMAALYLSEPAFLAGHPRRRERAEHIAQGGIGAMNGLAVLGVEQGLSPERLTGLAMDLLWPGIDSMTRPRGASL
jgi:AcrR family transcriptional regulator